MTRPKIPLGSLERHEYAMLRSALTYAVLYCETEANSVAPEEKQLWRDRASEFVALRARFGKRGRR